MTLLQLDPSAHMPWTRRTLALLPPFPPGRLPASAANTLIPGTPAVASPANAAAPPIITDRREGRRLASRAPVQMPTAGCSFVWYILFPLLKASFYRGPVSRGSGCHSVVTIPPSMTKSGREEDRTRNVR
jgi:hypothetical protein